MPDDIYWYSRVVAFLEGPTMSIPKVVEGYKRVVACSGLGSYFRMSYDVGTLAIFLQTPLACDHGNPLIS